MSTEPTILSLHVSALQTQIDAIEAVLRHHYIPFSTRMSAISHSLVFVVWDTEYTLDEAEKKFVESSETA